MSDDPPLAQWSEAKMKLYLQHRLGNRAALVPLLSGRDAIERMNELDPATRQAVERARDTPRVWRETLDDAEYQRIVATIDPNKQTGEPAGSFPPLFERPSLFTASVLGTIALGVTLCLTVFRKQLADWAGESEDDFLVDFAKYASIPVGVTVFTFVHVWFALWCTFYPLEFIGCWQIPGTNVGFPLGWRGIIPHKGDEMARMAVRMIKQHMLTVDEVFSRLEPDRMAEVLKPALARKMTEIIAIVAQEEVPALWNVLPDVVKAEISRRAAADAPAAVKTMFMDMRPEIDSLLDLEHLVVEVLVTDLRLCVDVFVVCGHKELAFVRNVGAWMGLVLGTAQMIVWYFYSPWWLLPVVGCVAGAFTNYVALLLIFWPVQPKRCCGLTLHGRFLRRQKEVAKAYAHMVANDVLKVRRIVNELINGAKKDRVSEIVRKNVRKAADDALSPLKPFIGVLGASERVERVKDRIAALIDKDMVEIMMQGEAYMGRAFDLEYTLQKRMANLPFEDFENLLHPIFQAEEWKLVLVGAVVGLIFGSLQVLFING